MPQPPFRSDEIEIENADAPVGPRLIGADENDGSMRFTDPFIPGGVNLTALAGLQQMNNTVVVSQTGIGASKDENGDPITTIQGGLDAVPDSADVDNPWTVFVAPGLYVEDVYLVKDGVTLHGLGTCRLRNDTAVSTLRIREGVSTTPRRVMILTLRIENVSPGEACLDIGSATFASGTLTITAVPNIGDMAEVGGVTLTAVANGTAPAPGEFELGTTTDETASNLRDALVDPVNGLLGVVFVTVVGSVVTIRAQQDGVGGNAITLSSSVPLIILASGPTLTGGAASSAGSGVGSNLIQVLDCDLVPTMGASFQLRASAINNLYVQGGNWNDGAVGTTVSVTDCALFELSGVSCSNLALNYDSTNPDLPLLGTSAYSLSNVRSSGTLLAGYNNVGSLSMTDCTVLGATVYSGSAPAQSLTARRCAFGPVTVGGLNPSATLSNCTRGTLTGAGTGTFRETRLMDSLAFVASNVETYTFAEPQPDLNYTVTLEPEGPFVTLNDVPFVPSASKTTAGFDIEFGAAQTLTINFVVHRDV